VAARLAVPIRAKVRRQIGQDRAPFALTRFDAYALAEEIRKRFGDVDDGPFIINVGDFKGHRANWIILEIVDASDEALTEVAEMCASQELHVNIS